MPTDQRYETVVGLEVHVQLSTASKIFCADSTTFGAEPNSQVSEISLAHPGTLPVINEKVLEYAIKLGLVLQCDINRQSYFERKNYFYPDLPKGYQITQQSSPVCLGGAVQISLDKYEKIIRLNRIHMEDDAGKSLHDTDPEYTDIDLNRAGIGLLEIVTEPDIRSGEEAAAFLTSLRKIVRWIDVCDGNMEEGSMRCDANVSVRKKGETKLGVKVEVKNLNSIRHVRKTIEFESRRLIELIEKGETVMQQTRLYNPGNDSTTLMRMKEEANDYRYFPEPDLPPLMISEKQLDDIKATLPELPEAAKKRYISAYNLSPYDAETVTSDFETCLLFEQLLAKNVSAKSAVNWIAGPVRSWCNENNSDVSGFELPGDTLAGIILASENKNIHFNIASTKLLTAVMKDASIPVEDVLRNLNLAPETDTKLVEQWIDEVLGAMPDKVKEYKKGKKTLTGLFAGEVKKRSKGRADMQLVNELLNKKLNQPDL